MAASLRPPFALGFFSPDLAPIGEKAKLGPALVILVVYSLLAFNDASRGSTPATEAKYALAGLIRR